MRWKNDAPYNSHKYMGCHRFYRPASFWIEVLCPVDYFWKARREHYSRDILVSEYGRKRYVAHVRYLPSWPRIYSGTIHRAYYLHTQHHADLQKEKNSENSGWRPAWETSGKSLTQQSHNQNAGNIYKCRDASVPNPQSSILSPQSSVGNLQFADWRSVT